MNGNERWGTDLRLLANLERGNDRDRGSDLLRRKRPETDQWDLLTLDDVANLKQALILRFLTPVGELALLGHPDYGSRLYELIGEPNTESNRNRAKMFTLLALDAEPRVDQVLAVRVTTAPANRNQINVDVSLRPIHDDTVLNLVFPFFLEGGPTP